MKKVLIGCGVIFGLLLGLCLISIIFGAKTVDQPQQENPVSVNYSIIDTDIIPGIKRSLEVRLGKKVAEEELRRISLALKSTDPSQYERTLIAYYLPGMKVGAGAWATARFDPNLEIQVLGVSVEEEKNFTAESLPANREVVGRWLDESPGFGGLRIMIWRENGKMFIEQKFRDGSVFKKELIEKQSAIGRRFDMVEGSHTGDYWIIDASGNLQSRDNEGLINTASKVE